LDKQKGKRNTGSGASGKTHPGVFLDGALEPVLILDNRLDIVYANKACLRLLTCTNGELIGMPFVTLLPSDNAKETVLRLTDCLQNDRTGRAFGDALLKPDGAPAGVISYAVPGNLPEGGACLLVHLKSAQASADAAARAEEKLMEISERFQKMFDYSAIGMSLTGLDGTIINANRSLCKVFGYSKEELERRSYLEMTYPEDAEYTRNLVTKMATGEAETLTYEKRFIRKNGEVFWAQVTAARLRETAGKPTYFITQLQDINTRKIMEEELISRQRFNQLIMDNLPIGIAVSSGKLPLRFEYMNDNFAEFFGTTKEALLGTDVFFDAVFEDPGFRRTMRRRILADIRSGDPKRMRWEYIPIAQKGMQTRYVTAYNAQVPGRDIWITIVTDETERVRALEVLEKNAARFRKLREFDQAVIKGFESYEKIGETTLAYIFELIDSDKAGIAIFHTEDNRVETVTAQKTGPEYEHRTHVLDEGEAELYQLQGRPAVYDAAEIADGKLAASIRRIFDIGGEVRGTHLLIRPLYSSSGPIGILYAGRHDGGFSMPDRDMLLEIGLLSALAVEQKRLQLLSEHYANDLEEMILERTAQLEEAVKELEAFTYTVSHDLRAPLRSMNGFVRILLEDYGAQLDDEGRRVCGIIAGSARQMGRLIDDLLALSRIGRSEMVILPVNMTALVKNLYVELTTEAQRTEIDFSVGRLPKVAADPALIRQVWLNLIDNAVKFTSKTPAPRIRVEGRHCGDEIVFSVSDNGVGFDMQFKDKLFGVFQRLHSVKEFEGTGVGLAIVERIIRRHGGRVWAEGAVNGGAAFYFSLKREALTNDTGCD